MDKIYILYSDGTWSSVKKGGQLASEEDKVSTHLKNHWWPFPLDIKGDSRRGAVIIRDATNIQRITGI